MNKVTKALGIAAIAAVSILGVAAPIHATSYDDTTNTMDVAGMGTDVLEGFETEDVAAFLADASDIATNGLTIKGTLDEVRTALVALHDYINASSDKHAEIKTALGAVDSFTIELTEDATLIDEDIAYINFFTGYVETDTPEVNIKSTGEVDLSGLSEDANTHANFTFGTVEVDTIVANDTDQLDGLGIDWEDNQAFVLDDGAYLWDADAGEAVLIEGEEPTDDGEKPVVNTPADVDAKA